MTLSRIENTITRNIKRKGKIEGIDLIITVVFLIFFIIIAISYEYIPKMAPPLKLGEYIIWNPVFMGVAFLTIFGYRYKKWKIRAKKQYKKPEQGFKRDKLG